MKKNEVEKIDSTNSNSKKNILIISISIVLLIVIIASLLLYFLVFKQNKYEKETGTYEDISDLELDYTFDSTYHYISNINYLDYLTVQEFGDRQIYNLSSNGVSTTNTPTENGATINSLINNVSENGGGVIAVDGNYVTTPIQLKDNIILNLKENCSLSSVTYEESISYSIDFTSEPNYALVFAKDAKNIEVVGPGTLKGNGTTYTKTPSDDSPFLPLSEFNVKTRVLESRKRLREAKTSNRSNLIYFGNCESVNIKSIRFYEAANWTCKIIDSNDVVIEDCVIDNNVHVANADGFDIVSSQDVSVEHCFVATADDGLCVKANGTEKVENVSFNRCTVTSMANCFKIGTETSKDITNVSCTNCYFFMDTVVGGYSGVAIESADGANVSDIYVDNINMKGISSPLLIWLGCRLDKNKGSDGSTMGSLTDVVVSNINAVDVEMASAITGCVYNNTTYYVKNVTLANFNVKYRDTGENLDVGPANYELNMNGYPEIVRVLHQYLISQELSTYYDLPVYGLFGRHVDGLTIYDFNVESRKCSTLPCDNVTQKSDRYDTLNVSIK